MPDNTKLNDNWCEKHWAPFREAVLAGRHGVGVMAPILQMQAMIDNEPFMAPLRAKYGDKQPPADAMNGRMAEIAPVCCFLGDFAMRRIFMEAQDA